MRVSFSFEASLEIGGSKNRDEDDTEAIGFDMPETEDDYTPIDEDHPGTWVNVFRRIHG